MEVILLINKDMIMIKQYFIVTAMCFFSLSVYADQSNLHQNCVSAMIKAKSAEQNSTEYSVFAEKACSCLLEKSPSGDVNDKKINKLCIFSGMLHAVTDDLDKNASNSEMMEACKKMVHINNPKPTDEDMNTVNAFCQCAQPKLLELFKKSDSMTDKEYDDGINGIAENCSAN